MRYTRIFLCFFLSPAFVCASPAFSLHPSRTPPRSQPEDVKPGVYPGLQTCTYCDLPFVKWAVNSGRIALQHPVLWQFVSATIPTKAAVKISPHGKAGVMKQCLFLCIFACGQTGHAGIFFACKVRDRDQIAGSSATDSKS